MALTDEQKATIAAGARTTDVTLRWTMSQLFFLIHSGLVTFVLPKFAQGTLVRVGLCFLGLWLALLWLLATQRAQSLIEHWIEALAELEGRGLSDRKRARAVHIFYEVRPKLVGIPTYRIFIWFVYTFLLVWLILLITSLISLVVSV